MTLPGSSWHFELHDTDGIRTLELVRALLPVFILVQVVPFEFDVSLVLQGRWSIVGVAVLSTFGPVVSLSGVPIDSGMVSGT